jgi:hypothetical protein
VINEENRHHSNGLLIEWLKWAEAIGLTDYKLPIPLALDFCDLVAATRLALQPKAVEPSIAPKGNAIRYVDDLSGPWGIFNPQLIAPPSTPTSYWWVAPPPNETTCVITPDDVDDETDAERHAMERFFFGQ